MFVTPAPGLSEDARRQLFCHFIFFISVFLPESPLVNMMEACSEALSNRLHFSPYSAAVVTILGHRLRRIGLPGVPAQDGLLAGCGHHLYLPFGAVLCAVSISLFAGIESPVEELNRGPLKPLGRSFPGHRLFSRPGFRRSL